MARFYATTEQKLIHSFWNALRIRRKINQLHQSSCYTSSIYYTTQNNPWICRYRFNGKVFLIFFLYHPLVHVKLKKSTVNFFFFHFKYFIDKSIVLDNRLCLYKSSPTTRWNNLNTIYIRHRAIYPSCILSYI